MPVVETISLRMSSCRVNKTAEIVDHVVGSQQLGHKLPEEAYVVPPVLRKYPCLFSYLE